MSNKMVLPPKYAKHLLSSLAALSGKVQDPAVALDLLVQTYCEHRINNDMNAPFRVQDVKNTLEVLEKQSGRVAETRSTGNEGSRNDDTVSSPELQPLSTPTSNTRPRGPRTVQFVNPDTNSMPPPPKPQPQRSRRSHVPATRDAGKSPSPSDGREMEKKGEFVVPPVPTHSKFTRATVSKDKGRDSEPGSASLYFLPADPEPPRKKRSNGGSRAAKSVLRMAAMTDPSLELGDTGTIDGVRTWKGRKIWESDIVDVAAEYYQWHMGSMNDCRQAIEKRKKGSFQVDIKGTPEERSDEDPGLNIPNSKDETQNKESTCNGEATKMTNISDEILSPVPGAASTLPAAEAHGTSSPDGSLISSPGSNSSLSFAPPLHLADVRMADTPPRILEGLLETQSPTQNFVELSAQTMQSDNPPVPDFQTVPEVAALPIGSLPPVHVTEAFKNKSSEIGGYVANMLGLAAMKFPDIPQPQESDEQPQLPKQVSFPQATAAPSTVDSAAA